ncbi:hypothetical protein ACMFMG_011111 [Clarireedia jacksonii]
MSKHDGLCPVHYWLLCCRGTRVAMKSCQSDQWKSLTDEAGIFYTSSPKRASNAKCGHSAINTPRSEVARGSPVVLSIGRRAVHHHSRTAAQEIYEQIFHAEPHNKLSTCKKLYSIRRQEDETSNYRSVFVSRSAALIQQSFSTRSRKIFEASELFSNVLLFTMKQKYSLCLA